MTDRSDTDRPEITNEDGKVPMDLAIIRGHWETKQRLRDIRSIDWVERLNEHIDRVEFAKVTVDAIKKHRQPNRREMGGGNRNTVEESIQRKDESNMVDPTTPVNATEESMSTPTTEQISNGDGKKAVTDGVSENGDIEVDVQTESSVESNGGWPQEAKNGHNADSGGQNGDTNDRSQNGSESDKNSVNEQDVDNAHDEDSGEEGDDTEDDWQPGWSDGDDAWE